MDPDGLEGQKLEQSIPTGVDVGTLSYNDPSSLESAPTPLRSSGEETGRKQRFKLLHYNKMAAIATGVAAVVIVGAGVATLALSGFRSSDQSAQKTSDKYAAKNLSLSVSDSDAKQIGQADKLAINGQLQIDKTVVIAPTAAPIAPSTGQLYFDKTSGTLRYYNGTTFVSLGQNSVTTLGGISGDVALSGDFLLTGNRLSLASGVRQQPATAGVTSFQGQNGAVTLSAGAGVSISGTTIGNNGVLSLAGGNGLQVSGPSGNVTVALPQAIGTTSTPTFGGLQLSSALGVTSGGTGLTSVTSNQILLGGGGNTVTQLANAAAGQCLVSNGVGAAPSFQACTGSSGVSSINGLNGVVTVANASVAGSTITLNNAAADGATKGIATFNATNFTAVGGVINTAQNIATTSSPSFASINLTSALTVGNGGTGSTTAGGARTNLGAAASGANSDITSLGGLTTALSLGQGGTGATTGAGARSNIGAAGSGANSDITSLSGLTTALSVSQGGTGFTTVTANQILIGAGGNTITQLANGSSGQCLVSNGAGSAPTFQVCTGAGGVSSLNGQTGVVTVANATAAAGTVTINNAAADGATKGIAAFNSTNFSAASGVINTIQGIATTSTPTFAGLVLTSALTVGNGGTGSTTAGGARTNLGAAASGANSDITSLAGLTTALSVGQGGTGSTSAGGARTNLGAAASGANGDITSITGLTTALSVSQGGTGLATITANQILIGGAANSITQLANGSSGQCLVSNGVGSAPSFQVCTGAGGVSSINSLTGAVTLANATTGGSTITINDAAADGATKGIAAFVSTNFSASSGVISIKTGGVTTTEIADSTITATDIANSTITGGKIANTTVANGNLVNSSLTVTAGSGLSGGGSISLGGSGSLSVVYGSASGTAVQGSTTLTCPAGTGNLTGGGDVITLGSGGTCSAIDITSNPIFAGTVDVQGSGGLTVGKNSTAGVIKISDGAASMHTASINVGTLASNQSYALPTTGGTICVFEAGNCTGSNSGGITGSGTTSQNYLPKFSNAGGTTVTNSTLYNDATGVSVGGSSPAALFNVGASNQFQVSTSGAVTAVGVDAGAGLIQGTNGLTVSGTATLSSLTSAGGQCLTTNGTGVLSLVSCLSGSGGGSGGVVSLNGLSGTLSINNASGSGSAVTIDDAKADGSTKGIAAFNSTNFSAASGVINTAQNINSTATPTFGGLTLSSALTVGNGGTGSTSAGGARTNLGAAASGANSDITSLSGLTTALSVSQGGTGLTNVSANRILLGGAGNTITQLATGSAGECLVSNGAGSAPTFQSCTGSGAVTSLDSLTGAITIANSTGSVGTITIDDAKADGSTKGIAAFNSTNFTDSAGVINTIQGIATTSSPTFAALSLTSALSVGNGGTGSTSAGGARTNLGAAASGANSDITSITGLTTALVVGEGGTGSTTAGGARTNLGAAASGANSDITSILGLTTALSVSQGGTGLTSVTDKQLIIGGAGNTVTQLSNGSSGQCLVSNGAGSAPSFQTCTGAGGVSSIDTLTGAVTLANSSGSVGTITIDNAKADGATKGIAAFNATNFTAAAGVINTVQNIDTGATPTFAGLNLSSALTVGNGGTGSTSAGGARTNLGAAASGANSDITSLTGLTTALSVGQGGTGSTSAGGARTNLGAAASGANSDITSLAGLTTALSVSQGGTGLATVTANQLLIGGASNTITQLANGSSGLCLISNGAGSAPSFQTCTGAGGVSSLNSQTGNITLANATGASGTITIDDAKADGTTKGIAAFNSTNFTASAGIINTIQGIATTSTPSFAGLTLTGGANVTTISASGQFTSTLTTGTAPFVVGSTTKVVNFNADLLDGLDSTAFAAGTGSGNYIQNQNAAQQASSNFWISGTGRADTSLLTNLLDGTTAGSTLAIGTTNATGGINLNQNVAIAAGKNITFGATGNFDQSASSGTFKTGTGNISLNGDTTLAASKSLSITGGNTASRPGSPTEGMTYYDTTTKQLITYSNGKWQSDRSDATYIVAASNATQAQKDGADYVATGTNDQTIINNALTAAAGHTAAGGKVYLTEGTFSLGDSVSIPNNTTLAGSGRSTILQFANLSGASKDMLVNTDTATPTGITVRDLQMDGNRTTNTTGTVNGVNFTASTAGGSGAAARQGETVTNIWVNNFLNDGIYYNTNSSNGVILNSVIQNNGGYGIRLNAASRDNIANNIIQGSGLYGLYISGTLYTVFGQNDVVANATGGVLVDGTSNNNTITGNTIRDNGGSGANDSIKLANASNNLITSNAITDTAGTGNAINLSSASAVSNYLADNTYSGTGATTINDIGVGTIYGGQLNSSSVFQIQDSTGIQLTGPTTVTGNLTQASGAVSLQGNAASTITTTSGNLTLDSAATLTLGNTNATAVTVGRTGITTTIQGSTAVALSGTTGTTMVCQNGSNVLSSCNASYLAPTAANFILNQSAANQTADFKILGTGTSGGFYSAVFDTESGSNVPLGIGAYNASVINLGAYATPTVAKGHLTVENGTSISYGLTINTATSGATVYTTPLGTSLGTSINIPNYDPGAFNQVIAFGLPASAASTSRALLVADARATAHQPTIGVLSPNETDIVGLSWDGSNSTALVRALTAEVGINSNGVTVAKFNGATGAISLQGNTTITGSNTFTSGTGTVSLQGATTASANVSITNAGSFATAAGAPFTTAGTSTSAALNTAGFYTLNTSGLAQVIQGITAGRDGQQLTLTNINALAVTLANNNAGGTALGKVITGTGGDVTIATGASAQLIYDGANTVWRVVGTIAGGGSGSNYVTLQASTPGTADVGSFNINGTGIASTLQAGTFDAASAVAVNIGTTNATSINLNQNTVVAAGKSIAITGGNTASRPGSPTEGMLYYDTSTKKLLVYSNGKWQADRSTAVIVAASNSTQAEKDSADYVATGSGDQTIINSALTAAAGGKVYLLEGTYTISGSISVPNNTTLAGSGRGTIITIANSLNASINAITNTTTGGSGSGVVIQDLRLDGNRTNQSSGTMVGIWLNGTGSGTGGSAVNGAKVTGVWDDNWRSFGLIFNDGRYNLISNSTFTNDDIAIGIYGSGNANNTITGNSIVGSNGTYGFGIYMDYNTSSYNAYTNNSFQGNVDGIVANSGSNNHMTITGNNFLSDSAYDVYLYGTTGNTITGNTFSSTGNSSVYLTFGTSNTTVTGNSFYNATSYGVFTDAGAAYNTISSNTFQDIGGATTNNAIYIGNNANYTTVTNNVINDSSATSTNYPITIATNLSTGNSLSGNIYNSGTISDSGTGTIYGGQLNSSSIYQIQDSTGIQLTGPTTVTGNLTQSSGAISLQGNAASTITTTSGNTTIDSAAVLKLGTSTATSVLIGGTANTFNTTIQSNLIVGNGNTGSTTALQVKNSGGTTALNVDTTNTYVGIGTATPSRTLDVAVSNTTTTSPQVLIEQAGSGDASIELKSAATSWYVGVDASDQSAFKINSAVASGGTSFFGNNTTGNATDTNDNNFIETGKWTATATGNVTSVSIYIGCSVDSSPNNKFRLGLYSDNGSQTDPNSLLATSAEGTLVTGWNTLSIPSTAVTSGTWYWLAYITNGTGGLLNCFNYTAGGAVQQNVWKTQAYAAFPGSFGVETNHTNITLSMYATIQNGTAFDSYNGSLFRVDTSGAARFQNVANSTAALQVQNAAGSNSILNVDTSANRIGINLATGATATADLSFGVGDRTINILDQTASNTAGNILTVNSGKGNGSGAGGLTTIQSGQGGATGAGGALTLQGGSGGATSGAGGLTSVKGGNATAGNSAGGGVTIQGGTATGTGAASAIAINAGNAVASGAGNAGGAIGLTAGNAAGTGANNGGAVTLTAGNSSATGTGNGGAVNLQGGTANGTNTIGGALNLTGGTGNGTQAGGAVLITAGTAGATGAGGAVTIKSGNAAGGTAGTVTLDTGTSFSGTSVLNLGNANAGSINIGHGTIATAITGNVGITNTGSATTSLSISTNTTPTTAALVVNDTSGTSTDKLLSLNASSTPKFTVDAAGNVITLGSVQAVGLTTTSGGSLATQKGTDYATNGNAVDVNFGSASLYRLTGSALQTIQSIAGTADGRHLTLVNAGSVSAVIKNQYTTGTTAADRIITGTGADFTLPVDASVTLVYDSGASRWRLIGGASGSSSYINNGTTTQTANFNIQSTAAGSTTALVQGAAGQSVDILSVQDSSNNTLFTVGSTGNILAKAASNSTTAFQIQNTSSVSLLTADTNTMTIIVGGTNASFGNLVLADAHFKISQTTAPTIGTPAACGTSPTAAVTAGSADNAGSFTVTTGTGSPTTCDTVVSFKTAFGAAPKSIMVVGKSDAGSAARQVFVSAAGTTSFTASLGSSGAASTTYSFSYWVVE